MAILALIRHEELDVERGEGCFVERERAFHVAYGQDDMVDHLVTFHALALLWAKRRTVRDGRRLPWDRTTPQSSMKISPIATLRRAGSFSPKTSQGLR